MLGTVLYCRRNEAEGCLAVSQLQGSWFDLRNKIFMNDFCLLVIRFFSTVFQAVQSFSPAEASRKKTPF